MKQHRKTSKLSAIFRTEGKSYTLLEVLDFTKHRWVVERYRTGYFTRFENKEKIESRLDKVTALYKNQMLLSNLREKNRKGTWISNDSCKVSTRQGACKRTCSP